MYRILGGAIALCLILLVGVSKYAMSVSSERDELKLSVDQLAITLANVERRRIELDKLAIKRANINKKLLADAAAYNEYINSIDNKDTQDFLNSAIPSGL